MMISAPAQQIIVVILATTPVTWPSGTAAIERSAAVNCRQDMKIIEEWTRLQWASIAPFGLPGVPVGERVVAVAAAHVSTGAAAGALWTSTAKSDRAGSWSM